MGTSAREPDAWSRTVAAQIVAERLAAGMTQPQVRAAAGITRSTYIRLESGALVADVIQVARIAGALGMAASTLIERAEEQFAAEP